MDGNTVFVLQHERYVASGGDVGSGVAERIAAELIAATFEDRPAS